MLEALKATKNLRSNRVYPRLHLPSHSAPLRGLSLRAVKGSAALFILSLLLASCSSAAHAQLPPTVNTTGETATPPRSQAPALPYTPTSAITLTPLPYTPSPPCSEQSGAIITDQFDSETLGYSMSMRIYLPPCYEDRERESYPVLYLLHGLNMDETAWDEIGVDETADALIASGEIPPLIIVMPRDRIDDRFGAALADELIPFIDSHYHTIADRHHRALGGMSRGAGWTAHVGFQQPALFGALGMHSLAIFYGDETRVSRQLDAAPPDLMPRIYIDIGQKDSLVPSARWLDAALNKQNIRHDYLLNPGSHTRAYWAEHLAEYLRWYTAGW